LTASEAGCTRDDANPTRREWLAMSAPAPMGRKAGGFVVKNITESTIQELG